MKAAFNIPPSSAPKSSLHVLIELGEHGIYFLWFTKDPLSVKGLTVYNFTETPSLTDLKNIFKTHDNLLNDILSVTICYDYRQSLLIPEAYNRESITEDALSLVYGEDNYAGYGNDKVTSAGIYVHYRLPVEIESYISERFPGASVFHSTSLQLELLNYEQNLLYCIFYHNSLKLILYKEDKLQIVQQFEYTEPQDAAYYLLNTCSQFAVNPSDVTLRLSGMIDEHSKLYAELYNYFQKLSFDTNADTGVTPGQIKELPEHFFSHLISLARCVS